MKAVMTLGVTLLCVNSLCAQTAAPSSGSDEISIERSSDPNTPPGDASETQLRAWANRYLDKGAFVEISPFVHTDPANRVFLYDPGSVEKLPDGHVTAWFRIELFRPVIFQGHSLRSVRKKLEIDCNDLRYKELIIENYAGANMQRRAPDLPFPDTFGKPEPGTSPQGIAARRVCNDANVRR